jgi:arabinose-5-phosphate isomerase
MVFYLNLRNIKILISFTHTNFYKNSILNTKENILISAKRTILSQSESIAKLIDFIDFNFAETTQLLYNSKGRLIVTGVGKSAIIAQKMVATFNSTGTPSIFLHATEAIHGDLGMVQPDDVVICISKSGNSPEIKLLIPILKRFGNTLIAITGNTTSFLAKESLYV